LSRTSKWRIQVKYDRARKKPLIEVKPWGILVILPTTFNKEAINSLLAKHENWITKKRLELQGALERAREIVLIEREDDEFRRLVRELVDEASKEILGMNPCRISIRRMKTRWASCSSKGTLTINYLAKYLPETLLSYIIYHEICHVLERSHNKRFWECVKRKFSEYEAFERELLAYEIKISSLLEKLFEDEHDKHSLALEQ
jgi:predicted metal-dependent hydrolase